MIRHTLKVIGWATFGALLAFALWAGLSAGLAYSVGRPSAVPTVLPSLPDVGHPAGAGR